VLLAAKSPLHPAIVPPPNSLSIIEAGLGVPIIDEYYYHPQREQEASADHCDAAPASAKLVDWAAWSSVSHLDSNSERFQ
jgi:hypothetical protein